MVDKEINLQKWISLPAHNTGYLEQNQRPGHSKINIKDKNGKCIPKKNHPKSEKLVNPIIPLRHPEKDEPKPIQSNLTQPNPTQLNSTQLNPTQPNSNQLNTTQPNPTQPHLT